ncbi:Piwi-domain-containing protein [Aaosphaeria arxii CBS 175.79]|uniref:Piwi-domain-containing protein n=1 Tax=Aaosphaeria arxii CBS 175.79 TaxID=1450172 RepID=A0A6A5Y8F7_9PLEO|nr:Piwi-domain-containing protein [Aaosphaeria arxii CBS 175.79]KAF2021031.1 Piwi-domain-containing protein [Aaosphaeria arxii CBS 175.79]
MADSRGRGRGRGDGGRGRGGGERGGGGRGRGGFDGASDRGRGGFRGNGERGGYQDRGRGAPRGNSGRGGHDDRGRGGPRGGRGDRGGRGGSRFESARAFGNGSFPQPDQKVSKAEDALVSEAENAPASKAQDAPVNKAKDAPVNKAKDAPVNEAGDAPVKEAEDALVSDVSTALASTTLEEEFPRRPGYGSIGTPIVLWTNYLELNAINPQAVFYRYSVVVQGQPDLPKPKKKRLIQLLLKEAPFSNVASTSDWAQLIVTTQKVKLDGNRASYHIEWYPNDGEPLPSPEQGEPQERTNARNRSTYMLLVEQLGTVSLEELVKDISASGATYPLKMEAIQALNLVMANGPSLDDQIAVAGQNHFYPFGKHPQVQSRDLTFGLQALRGYFSSVRTSVDRIIVNINVATGAFYKPGPLLDMLRELGLPAQFAGAHQKAAGFVRGLRIETNYLPASDKKGKRIQGKTKRKVHAIIELSRFGQNASNTTFPKTAADGTTRDVTVADHFETEYGLRLQLPQAPLVNYGTRESPKWIPGELCSILPGQLARRLLSGKQTSEMIKFAARRPVDNAESIVRDGLQVTKIMPVAQGLNTNLKPFGIKVATTLLTVHGRVLQAPVLHYKRNTCTPRNGAWNLDVRELGNEPFKVAKPLPTWGCLIIVDSYDTHTRSEDGQFNDKETLTKFQRTLNTYGMKPKPYGGPVYMEVTRAELQDRKVDAVQRRISTSIGQFKLRPQFLFIVLPSEDAVLYDCIKFVCDTKLGIPSICSIGHKFRKEQGRMQYFANVAMKFNQKLGGINHTLSADHFKPLDSQTIVFGIDVTHPSPGSSESSPSIAGIVASIDGNFAQYPASIRTQKGRKEMVSELAEMVVERLKLWQKLNGKLPTKVIVYRDGVSEGQYKTVLQEEYPCFVTAFNKLYGAESKHPKISIIVVGKRHHTRFYPTKIDETNADVENGNPKPGTVVDRGVTGEKLFDFFLLAHQGLQGTSKPAHYVVLKDENKLGADQLQTLTHNLCYTFARATRAVSVCPPAYYADLLCERGRSYLHRVLKGDGSENFTTNHWHGGVHANLAETMFYL